MQIFDFDPPDMVNLLEVDPPPVRPTNHTYGLNTNEIKDFICYFFEFQVLLHTTVRTVLNCMYSEYCISVNLEVKKDFPWKWKLKRAIGSSSAMTMDGYKYCHVLSEQFDQYMASD